MKAPCVYIITNERNGTLYTGVTSNLIQRIWQHKNKTFEGFASKHDLSLLIWFEQHETMEAAITREKQLKEWQRKWKLRIIEEMNPDWRDLYEDITK